VAAEPSY
jgi:hypothetical protein